MAKPRPTGKLVLKLSTWQQVLSTPSLTIPSFQGDPKIFNNVLYPQLYALQGNKETSGEITKIRTACKKRKQKKQNNYYKHTLSFQVP